MSKVVTHGQTSSPSCRPRAIVVQVIFMAGTEANGLTSAKVIALGWPAAVTDDRAIIDGV